MDFLIIFIKCLIIIIVNIGLGWLISYSWHFFLFYPKKIYLLGKYHFYFSPGILYKGKSKFINYLHQKLKEYFEYAEKGVNHANFLTKFEKDAYREIYAFLKEYLEQPWMSDSIKAWVKDTSSKILWIAIRHITRSVFPRILLELKIEHKIDILDMKLDIEIAKKLFEEHIYKYFKWFNLLLFSVVGLVNMVLFLVLK